MLGKDVMKKTLTRLQDPAYAMLRIVAGFMFSFHGMQKLFGLFGGHAIQFGAKPQLFIGGVIELLCGVAIAAGLLTRWAALLASGTMAVAYLQFHFAGDFSSSHWLPIVNKGELAVAYCFTFLLFAAHGPGAASLDRKLKLDA
jgi:putative oxidoreductase